MNGNAIMIIIVCPLNDCLYISGKKHLNIFNYIVPLCIFKITFKVEINANKTYFKCAKYGAVTAY